MDLMTESTRSLTALHALLSRHVWDDENDPETIYIQGHGLTTPQVDAIVREWFEMVDDGHTDGVAVQSWTEVAPFDMADGSKVYATRARVTFGN